MQRSAQKCEKNKQIQKEKMKQAMKSGNIEGFLNYMTHSCVFRVLLAHTRHLSTQLLISPFISSHSFTLINLIKLA